MKAADAKKIENLLEKNRKTEKKVESFSNALKDMTGVESQKTTLWVEIYDNATNDRTTASALFTQAFMLLGSSNSDHVSLGPTLVKYLERMSKSNEQLLALAQIIAKEVERKSTIDSDDIFSQIEEPK